MRRSTLDVATTTYVGRSGANLSLSPISLHTYRHIIITHVNLPCICICTCCVYLYLMCIFVPIVCMCTYPQPNYLHTNISSPEGTYHVYVFVPTTLIPISLHKYNNLRPCISMRMYLSLSICTYSQPNFFTYTKIIFTHLGTYTYANLLCVVPMYVFAPTFNPRRSRKCN